MINPATYTIKIVSEKILAKFFEDSDDVASLDDADRVFKNFKIVKGGNATVYEGIVDGELVQFYADEIEIATKEQVK